MKRILATISTALLAAASSEVSVWVCLAAGAGAGAYGRDYNVVNAKFMALRGCERRAPITLVWCRPGWQ